LTIAVDSVCIPCSTVIISQPHTPIASKDYLKRGKLSNTVTTAGA